MIKPKDLARKQVMVGRVHKDLEAILEKAPETRDEIVKLSMDVSRIINVYMLDEPESRKNLFGKIFK